MISQTGEGANHEFGAKTCYSVFNNIFADNCMKIKETGTRVESMFLAPLEIANGTYIVFCFGIEFQVKTE